MRATFHFGEFIKKHKADKKTLVLLGLFLLGLVLLVLSSGSTKRSGIDDSDLTVLSSQAEKVLEDRIRTLLSSVSGAGKIKVMVTLEGLTASEEGSVRQKNKNALFLLEDASSSEKTVLVPEIRGVGVTCTGGASAKVRQEIVSLLSAVLGIGENRIYVTEGE